MLAGLMGSPAASVGDTMRGLENASSLIQENRSREHSRGRRTLKTELGRVVAGARHGEARGREESLDGVHWARRLWDNEGCRSRSEIVVEILSSNQRLWTLSLSTSERSQTSPSGLTQLDLGIRRQRHPRPSLAHRASPSPDGEIPAC